MVVLAAVAVLALVTRLYLVDFGLPDLNHPDEPTNINTGVAMAHDGTLIPSRFNYPSFLFDVVALAARLRTMLGGRLDPDTVAQWQGFGIGHTADPHFVLALRLITVAASVAMCLVVTYGAARLTGRWRSGLVAGSLLAVSPIVTESGVYITPDTYTGLFCACALVAALAVHRHGSWPAYLLCGAAVGLATGSKWNAALVVVGLFAAHVVRLRAGRPAPIGRLLAALGAALVVLVVTTPGLLTEPRTVVDGIRFEAEHYRRGHPGYSGNSLRDYAGALVRSDLLLILLALAAVVGAVALVLGRARRLRVDAVPPGALVVPAVFAGLYFALVSMQQVHFDRNLLPLMPALALLAGAGVEVVLAGLGDRALPLVVLVVLALGWGVHSSFGLHDRLEQPARAQARQWLADRLPPGARIVRESYGPWLDPTRFPNVVYSLSAGESGPPPAGTAAIVIDEQTAGRYLRDPQRYPAEAAAYQRLQSRFCRAVFYDDGPWVAVLVPCR